MKNVKSRSKSHETMAVFAINLLFERKKKNHLHTNSKMMGTLVQLQLYTLSYRKAVIRPQNMPKTADWGQKRSNLWYFKMAPQVQPKCFSHAKHMINNWHLKKKTGLSHQVCSHRGSTLKKINLTLNGHFSRPEQTLTDPYVNTFHLECRRFCSHCRAL